MHYSSHQRPSPPASGVRCGRISLLFMCSIVLLLSEHTLARTSGGRNNWIHGIRDRLRRNVPNNNNKRKGSSRSMPKNERGEWPEDDGEESSFGDVFSKAAASERDTAPPSWPLMLWQAIPPAWRDPAKWAKLLASSAQVGCGLYLGYSIYKAAVEVIEEFSQELSGTDPLGFSVDQVLEVIEFLEQPAGDAKAQLERASESSENLPHLATLQIAQKLALAGLPLKSSSTDNEDEDDAPTTITGVIKPSVEMVLLSLTRVETSLLQQCLWVPPPNELRTGRTTTWDDIVGLDRVKNGLLSSLRTVTGKNPSLTAYESLFEHSSSCNGVILYGPPGCGKSFLIKALSAQSKLPCLVISPSLFLRKYVGETNQNCRALFSLAQKLAPCILCIDEVDGLFRERSESEHEVSRDLKTEFLQHMDGMMSTAPLDVSGRKRKNLVVAATNRPFDVDSAILRRFTQSHLVGMPDFASRSLILQHLLASVPKDDNLDLLLLAERTEGYTPSGLRQLLQEAAALGPLQEASVTDNPPPPLSTEHVLQAMQSVRPTPFSAQYKWALANFAKSQGTEPSEHQTSAVSPAESAFLSGTDNQVSRWETNYGNFYHLGAIQIDAATFDDLVDIAQSVVESDDDDDDEDADDDHDESDF